MSDLISISEFIRDGVSKVLTDVFEHFVALINDEHLYIVEIKCLVTN